MNLRELVLDMLLQMERESVFSHILLRNVLDKHDYLTGQEKGFIKRVTEGTIERRIQLDYLIDAYSSTPIRKMKPLIRSLLRMSVYQILFMDGVPDSAVCNEAVKLAVKRKFTSLKGFVNGVLRNVARNKENLVYPDKEKDLTEYLCVWYSMPRFLIEMWLGEYGEKETEELLCAFQKIKPVSIRMREDLEHSKKEELIESLTNCTTSMKNSKYLPYAYVLEGMDGVFKLPGFAQGLFVVQDESSMLCVEAAGIQPGALVLDVCAAPGGKATHAAIKLRGTGKVIARDVSEEKIALIQENIERQNLSNIEAQIFDATQFDGEMEGKADVVFADLPCSGLGILGKKRDIKYNVSIEQIASLSILQKEILDCACRYVKPGGTLVYSTCTVSKAENEQAAAWIEAHYPFEREVLFPWLPEGLQEEFGASHQVQLLPHKHGTDGFFFARFKNVLKTKDGSER